MLSATAGTKLSSISIYCKVTWRKVPAHTDSDRTRSKPRVRVQHFEKPVQRSHPSAQRLRTSLCRHVSNLDATVCSAASPGTCPHPRCCRRCSERRSGSQTAGVAAPLSRPSHGASQCPSPIGSARCLRLCAGAAAGSAAGSARNHHRHGGSSWCAGRGPPLPLPLPPPPPPPKSAGR